MDKIRPENGHHFLLPNALWICLLGLKRSFQAQLSLRKKDSYFSFLCAFPEPKISLSRQQSIFQTPPN